MLPRYDHYVVLTKLRPKPTVMSPICCCRWCNKNLADASRSHPAAVMRAGSAWPAHAVVNTAIWPSRAGSSQPDEGLVRRRLRRQKSSILKCCAITFAYHFRVPKLCCRIERGRKCPPAKWPAQMWVWFRTRRITRTGSQKVPFCHSVGQPLVGTRLPSISELITSGYIASAAVQLVCSLRGFQLRGWRWL